MLIVVVVVLVVLVLVVPVVWYFMVVGYGGTSITTPAATYAKVTIPAGERVTVVSITKFDVPWDEIRVQLSDSNYNIWEWSTATADLDGGSAITADYGSVTEGGLTVWLSVTDVDGNGFVSGSDYFSMTTTGGFYSEAVYFALLVYEPTGERIGTGVTFTV